MCAVFKLALRNCKAAAEQLKADARAKQLAVKCNHGSFWKGISKDSCKKAASYANKVGEAAGAVDVWNMWHNQFSCLYNLLNDHKSKQDFCSKADNSVDSYKSYVTVNDVSVALRQQKTDKSAGTNGLYMESFIYTDTNLHVHLSLLYTLYL